MKVNLDEVQAIRSAFALADYIRLFYGDSIPKFAEAQGTTRHHIHKWIERGAVVVDGAVYTYRRELVAPDEVAE